MVRMNSKPVEASEALVRFNICLFVPFVQKEGWVYFFKKNTQIWL